MALHDAARRFAGGLRALLGIAAAALATSLVPAQLAPAHAADPIKIGRA